MDKRIDFYFDFISPFSYLAYTQLPDLVKRYGWTLDYHPMDIPVAKLAAGNYAPSNMKQPAKIKALMQDMHRWAARYGVPLKFPSGMVGRRINTGAFLAQQEGCIEDYVREGFHRLWGLGGADAYAPEFLRQLASDVGLDPDQFMAYVDSKEGEKAFEASKVAAHARGVFGAPIMMIGDQIWWGNDRLMFLEEYLQQQAA